MPVRDPQPMDAGFEHTMLGVGGRGKYVVAVGDRWTGYYLSSRDAVAATVCSRSAAPAITGKPTAINRVECRLVSRRRELHARSTSAHHTVAGLDAIEIVGCENAQLRSHS